MVYKKYTKFFIFLLMLLFLFSISFLFYSNNQATAKVYKPSVPSGQNVSGFAWNANIGWISFNSSGCDTDDNDFIDTDAMVNGCGGDNTSNVSIDYGVHIDNISGDISGHAWSSNVGWISFDRADTGNPPTPPYLGSGAIARYNSVSGFIAGWAKVMVMGDDGWIRFDHGQSNEAKITMGSPSELRGYAWGASDVSGVGIGWISLNCADEGICGSNDYKVEVELNQPPNMVYAQLYYIDPPSLPELVAPSGTGYIPVGGNGQFRVGWTDPNIGDNAIAIICKNNSNPDLGGGWPSYDCQGGAVNRWRITNTSSTQHPAAYLQGSMVFGVPDIGSLNNIYVTVCDEWGACTSPSQLSGVLVNDVPIFIPSTDTGVVTAPPLVMPTGDEEINFSADWTDIETNGEMHMYVCRTIAFDDSAKTCSGGNWCSASDITIPLDDPLTCSYTANLVDGAGTKDYYIYVCDGYGTCSPDPGDNSHHGQFTLNTRSQVGTMSAPNFIPSSACSNPAVDEDLLAGMYWSFVDADSDNLSDIEVDVNGVGNAYTSSFNNSDIDNDCISNLAVNDCQLIINSGDGISWGNSYTWQVRVNDGMAWSEWESFDIVKPAHTLTPDANANANNVNGNNTTFSTYVHNFPIPLGSPVEFLPADPSAGEEVRLTPHSLYYVGAGPTTSINCLGSSMCNYNWALVAGSFKGSNSIEEPIAIFDNDGAGQNFNFDVTDLDGYVCNGASSVTTNKKLPSWIETY